MPFSSFIRYFFITSLLSLFTVVYLGKAFSEDKVFDSNYSLELDNPFLSESPSVISTYLASSFLKHFNLNLLSAALFRFAGKSSLLYQQRVAALIFINLGFLILYLAGTFTARFFFIEIREIEYQHLYDRVLNFLLFKVVFLGAILEPKWDVLFLWVAWLAFIGYLRVFSMLCRDRCEFIFESTSLHPAAVRKLLAFLILIILADIFWFLVCLISFRSMLFLLTFECFTLLLDTIQTLVKCIINLQNTSAEFWESKDLYIKKIEFFIDAAILVATLVHYFQIALIHGISFTLIDAVLFLNIRSVFKSLHRKYRIYKSYRFAILHLKNRFPSATDEDLVAFGSVCAICLEGMTIAQKLPCNHLFHIRCLGLWLENQLSCPTCRKKLEKAENIECSIPQSMESERHMFLTTNENIPFVGASGFQQSSASSLSSDVEWDHGLSVLNNLMY